jgi:hypothetical protein
MLFKMIDRQAWKESVYNPVRMLRGLPRNNKKYCIVLHCTQGGKEVHEEILPECPETGQDLTIDFKIAGI